MEGVGLSGANRAGPAMLARLRGAGIAAEGFGLVRPGGVNDNLNSSDFAMGLRVLILIADDIAECEALLFETAALAKRAKALETLIIATTLSPRYVRALRGRVPASVALVDAPFTGTASAAEKGQLSFFLGGRRDEIQRLQPIFSAIGRQGVRMGGFGAAMAAKVLNDFLAASSTAMTRIALDWAEAQGIDESKLLEMTNTSIGNNVLMPGYEMTGFGTSGQESDEVVAALMKDVEAALDAALAGAHLTPPRAAEQLFSNLKPRALH